MAEEAHLCDGANQPFWCPTLKHAEHDRRACGGEHKGKRGSHYEGDDLVFGRCRDAGADSQQCTRHKPAADIAREDHPIVRPAEKVDGDPEWESQRQCDTGKTPGGEEFSDHRLGHAYRQRQEQLDRPALALLGPQPHRQSRDQDEIEPGMKGEKGLQVSLAPLKEIAEEKCQHSRHDQKYYDEHISERGREIAGELAAKNGQDIAHCRQAAAATGAGSCGTVVISRKTSSSRPRSTLRPVTSQPWARARSATFATIGPSSPGKIINASPSLSLTASTAATPGSRANSARTCGWVPAGTPRRTALWWRERSASCAGVPSAKMRPCAMMIARLHTASTSSSRWVEIMIAFSGRIAPMIRRISYSWLGSSPSVGSSRISTSGSCSNACATPTRRLKPFDNVSIG